MLLLIYTVHLQMAIYPNQLSFANVSSLKIYVYT
uniref:Uncharacterized protein n=1 Tax=Arundo donax TaxID=35708 RepID=A0A0A9F6W6_ARUDO